MVPVNASQRIVPSEEGQGGRCTRTFGLRVTKFSSAEKAFVFFSAAIGSSLAEGVFLHVNVDACPLSGVERMFCKNGVGEKRNASLGSF